jgi:hypothetical protein
MLNKLVIGKGKFHSSTSSKKGDTKVTILVIILYSKTEAKGSKYNSVTDSSNIMAISNIGIQVFEQSVGTHFHETFQDKALFTPRFDFIPLTAFLCALIHTPNYTPGLGLRLTPLDFQVFESLTKVFPDLVKLMKALKSKSDGGNQGEVDGDS